jgi:hypothetical protein
MQEKWRINFVAPMNVEGGILQRGVHRKTRTPRIFTADGAYPFSLSRRNLDLVQKGPRRRLNFLAPFGSRPPPTVSPHLRLPLLHCACTGSREETAPPPPRVPPQSPQLPAPTNPPNLRALASPPGHFRRKFVPKPQIFFRPFAFAPPAPFSFLTPPRSVPLLLCLIVFSRRKARFFEGGDRGFASGGVDSVPRCGFAPNFASGEGIMDFSFRYLTVFDLFRWRRDYVFGEISLARF